jgi:putative nucleotidyltransferase with HDIG domain
MEHTHRVVRLTRMTADIFPDLNRGLLLAGAILHDLGKIKEIEDGVTAKNSFEGQLLGHIVLGWEMVREMGINIIDQTISIMISLHKIDRWRCWHAISNRITKISGRYT